MSGTEQKSSQTPRLALGTACILFLVGFWGYAANDFVLHTGLTPMISGLIFAIASFYIWKHPGKIERYLITFALVLAVAFVWPLMRNVEQVDPWGIFRTATEMVACVAFAILALRQKPENSLIK